MSESLLLPSFYNLMCIKGECVLSFTISVQLVITALLYHIPTPFIVEEGRSKGVSAGLSGFVIAVASAPSLFLGLCTGRLALRFGRKRLLIYAILVESGLSAAFATTEYAASATLFVALATPLRLLLGAHIFLHKTLGYMLASKHLYAHYQRMSLFLMVAINVGMVLSGFLGNLIYQASS